jgi:hypothetical protein
MYQLSALMAGFYNWCLTRAERMPRWQGFAITGVAILGFVVSALFAPNRWIFVYWLLVLGPVAVFGHAHSRVWKKRDDARSGQDAQMKKTQKLLKGFKQ